MSSVRNQSQPFGIDLTYFARDVIAAWRAMLDWPMLAWLWPKQTVRVWRPEGDAILCHGPGARPIVGRSTPATAFNAVLLPEHLILRTSLTLPQLQSEDLQSAVALQVANLNPFDTSDLVWRHDVVKSTKSASGTTQVELAMASRRLIFEYVRKAHSTIAPDMAEIWIQSSLDNAPELILPGFGEAARLRHGRIWRWISVLLALIVVSLLTFMAVTPTVQLYIKAQQAYAAMAALQQKADPVLKQREVLTRNTELLGSLVNMPGRSVSPLQALKLVTDALPDDTSLLSLQLQGMKVSMSGQTVNAAALMKQLGSIPGLRDVTAPTPAIKPLGAPRESFTIEFVLDPVRIAPIK